MIFAAILMSIAAAWSLADVFAATYFAEKREMSSDFVPVYARLFIVATIAAISLWVAVFA